MNNTDSNFKDKIQKGLAATLKSASPQYPYRSNSPLLYRLLNSATMHKDVSYTKIVRAVHDAFYKEFDSLTGADGYSAYYVTEVLDKTVIIGSWDEVGIVYEATYSMDKENKVEFASRDEWVGGSYKFVAS